MQVFIDTTNAPASPDMTCNDTLERIPFVGDHMNPNHEKNRPGTVKLTRATPGSRPPTLSSLFELHSKDNGHAENFSRFCVTRASCCLIRHAAGSRWSDRTIYGEKGGDMHQHNHEDSATAHRYLPWLDARALLRGPTWSGCALLLLLLLPAQARSREVAASAAPTLPAPLAATSAATVGGADPLPAAIASMVLRGRNVSILGSFRVDGSDLTAWVMQAAGERRIYYVPPSGLYAIYGLMFDQDLNNMTTTHALRIPQQPSAVPAAAGAEPAPAAQGGAGFGQGQQVDQTLALLGKAETSHVEGRGRNVYIIYDPACIYCHKFWRDTRSALDQIRIHWVPIALVSASSRFLAEAVMASPHPAEAMAAAANQSLTPARTVSNKTDQILKRNARVFAASGKKNVPYITFSDQGKAYAFLGAPGPAALRIIIGGSKMGAAKEQLPGK
jgi:hypothetical protein